MRVLILGHGLSKRTIVSALERAFIRGVTLRFVGDSRHGSECAGVPHPRPVERPRSIGNQTHIMPTNSFIDGRFVVTGTGNITTTGFGKNDVGSLDSPEVAADFTAEFEQMFDGRFYAKYAITTAIITG